MSHKPQRPVGTFRNPDSRRCLNLHVRLMIRAPHRQRTSDKTAAVQLPRDAHRLRQLARTGREVLYAPGFGTPPEHHVDSAQRLQTAYQNTPRLALRLAHKIQTLVHSVDEIYVCVAGRAEQHLRPFRDAACRVRRQIAHAQVRFRLNDSPGGLAVDQDLAETISRHVHRASRVEIFSQ